MRLHNIVIICLMSLSASLSGSLSLADSTSVNQAETGTIVIVISEAQSDHGTIRASLYDDGSVFTERGKSIVRTEAPLNNGNCRLEFTAIPYGTYGISLFHDENGDCELNTNWLGIPREGVGFSNDAPLRMGPPDWEDAVFQHDSSETLQQIHIRYDIF